MNFSGSGYGLIDVIGGFVLLAALIWAVLRNRGARNLARTEQATRDLYTEANERDTGTSRKS